MLRLYPTLLATGSDLFRHLRCFAGRSYDVRSVCNLPPRHWMKTTKCSSSLASENASYSFVHTVRLTSVPTSAPINPNWCLELPYIASVDSVTCVRPSKDSCFPV